ncbi:hypothetical protein BDF22DRAFT_378900 [Syncephalis plumigaleata]|nr:hypothetical protein BDF22DRAFT_378900 [Syncephalis plumigaleata]
MVSLPDKVPGRRFFRKLLRRKSSRTNTVYNTVNNGSVATFCAITSTENDAADTTAFFDATGGASPRLTMRSTSAAPYLSYESPDSTYHTARSVLPSSTSTSTTMADLFDATFANNKQLTDDLIVPLASSMSVRRVPIRRPPIPSQLLHSQSSLEDSSSEHGDNDSLSAVSLYQMEQESPTIDEDKVDMTTPVESKLQLSHDDTSSILLLDTALSFKAVSKSTLEQDKSQQQQQQQKQYKSNARTSTVSRPTTPLSSTKCSTPDMPTPSTPPRVKPTPLTPLTPSSPLRSVRRTASNVSLATAERAQRRAATATAAASTNANATTAMAATSSSPSRACQDQLVDYDVYHLIYL